MEGLAPPKSAALLAAPGVLEPTAFMLALTDCFSCLRGSQSGPNSKVDLAIVEAMLAQFSLLGAFFSLMAGS